MKNLRDEIPKRAFINAEIIQSAVAAGDLQNSVDAIKRKYRMPKYEIMNQAYVISLLYCLLVVPKELWLGKDKKHDIYSELEEREPLRHFTIELSATGFTEHPVYSLIHALRNSVAHARFSVDHSLRFVFWDQYPGASSPHFRASITSEELMVFLSDVGSLLANL